MHGDDSPGGALIARHPLEVGHQRVASMNGARATRLLDARREGVRTSPEAAGGTFVEIIAMAMTAAGGERGTRELLELRDPPTALVCANDLMALGPCGSFRRGAFVSPVISPWSATGTHHLGV